MPPRGKCHSCECCQNCRYRLSLKKFDYTKAGCEHTEMDGFICTVFADEGVAVWMVGLEECEEQCECWERNVVMKHRTVKKHIRRNVTWFAKHKIPKAFRNRRERDEWIDWICKFYNR